MVRDGISLSFEAFPLAAGEAVFYLNTLDLKKAKYGFNFVPRALEFEGREAYLKDKFLNILYPINTTEETRYEFEGTDDPLSVKPDRFEIVFKQSSILPVTFLGLQAVEKDSDIKVTWKVATERNVSHYEVEHSRNGVDFGKAIQVKAQNQSPATYDWLHVKPGNGSHFYRIRGMDNDGKFNTSQIVKVNIGGNKPSFTAFPTVITESSTVSLQINSMKKGIYNLEVTDMAGRVIQSSKISLDNGSAAQVLTLPQGLQAGRYNIRLSGESGRFLQVIFKD